MLYGEALNTNWLTSQQKIDASHRHFIDDGWNTMRVVAKGPRIQTWVNGHAVEDYTNEELYKSFRKGFIALQVHSISDREISQTVGPDAGITTRQPLMVKYRNIRVRPLR